jgi:hypothetical protein
MVNTNDGNFPRRWQDHWAKTFDLLPQFPNRPIPGSKPLLPFDNFLPPKKTLNLKVFHKGKG